MIDTWSVFNFGFKIDAQPFNGFINLDEGSGPITVELPVGSFTLSSLVVVLRNALNTQGSLNYDVVFDRTTHRFTISADQPFDLLLNSGQNSFLTALRLYGFSSDQDLLGQTSYMSNASVGERYYPQFKLQDFVAPENLQQRNQSSKNVASDGTTIEVVNFGLAKFIELNLRYIHSVSGIADGFFIRKNPRGLEDAQRFLQFITELNEFEFVPDVDRPGFLYRVIVESMPEFRDGTGYRLRELFAQNLRDVFETGIIRLRVID